MSSRSAGRAAQRKVALGLTCALAVTSLAGCEGLLSKLSSDDDSQTVAEADTESSSSVPTADDAATIDVDDLFSDRDLDPSYSATDVAATIELTGTGADVDGSGVSVDGTTVTITAEGTYVVSGTLDDGQIIVDVDDSEKVQIVLDGASITSSSSAALYVRSADKVFLTLADGSENALATTGEFVDIDDNSIDGAIFSKDDLTINGEGSLTVSCAEGHGIVVKDDLTLVSGTVDVTAAGHAIQAKKSVAACGGTWTLVAGTDGIHCENDDDATEGWAYIAGGTFDITAASDGVDVSNVLVVAGGEFTVAAADDGLHAELDLTVEDGTITVTESYEGLEGSTITIAGGTIDITASDDGLNAAGEPSGTNVSGADGMTWQDMGENDETAWLLISGGTLTVDAGGDGLDSNGDLTITGGEVYVSGPTSEGDGALDYGGDATISGGIIIAVGTSGMAEGFSDTSTQGSMLVTAAGSAGDTVTLYDEDGNVLASYTPTKSYECVIASAPGVEEGGTYILAYGDGESSEVTLDGIVYNEVGVFMNGMGTNNIGGGQEMVQQMQQQSPDSGTGDGQMGGGTGDGQMGGGR